MSQPASRSGADRIPVGISSCLMGARVRYDGGHKANSYIMETLAEYFDFHQFCPEIDVGMSVPRTPIRLTRKARDEIRCVAVDADGTDFTEQLLRCGDEQRAWHGKLCGYILKQDSPSCGMQGVKVFSEGVPERTGVGIYAARMMHNFPYLPVAEEGSLGDAVLRENFIQRVCVLRRWYEMVEAGLKVASLLEFHASHRLIILRHDQESLPKLDQLVAAFNLENLQEQARTYLVQVMAALKIPATPGSCR